MNTKVSACTSFLFAPPSFGSGAARALDMFGAFDRYNSSPSEAEADELAIAADWLAVGQDLGLAFDEAGVE